MNDWKLTDEHSGNTRHFDSRAEAEEAKQDLESIAEGPLTIEQVTETDDTAEKVAEADPTNAEVVEATQTASEVPENPSVADDPVDWMPSHFIDHIQGVPTVNRKGYAVIASQYNVSVEAVAKVRASETNFEYAEFAATAITEDGQRYTGFGSAHINRQDGDDPYLLNELAETRAMKRAVAWATGVGMTAASEMQNEL
jgi:hypothetical protein